MATQILMPALSPTMEEGKLAKWLVKEGDEVHSGDILAEIETDKATMEFEAVDEGRIGKILVPEGTEGVKVNTPIASLLGEGEDARHAGHRRRDGVDQGRRVGRARAASPPKRRSPQSGDEMLRDAVHSPERGSGARKAGRTAPTASPGKRIFASPLARRLAARPASILRRCRVPARAGASSKPTSRRRRRLAQRRHAGNTGVRRPAVPGSAPAALQGHRTASRRALVLQARAITPSPA